MPDNRPVVGQPDMSQEASLIHGALTVAIVLVIGAGIAFFAAKFF
jgi:hypothetical protein